MKKKNESYVESEEELDFNISLEDSVRKFKNKHDGKYDYLPNPSDKKHNRFTKEEEEDNLREIIRKKTKN